MRIGDFAVEVIPRGKGIGVREIGSGHVLARPGQVYALRLRNFGPLRCVADISIDGRSVSAGGLVIDAYCTEELERPITPDEDGRFTVVAEGDERVFGPDGGRDNPNLGLIEVRFRRELPDERESARPLPGMIKRVMGRPTPPPPAPSRFDRGIIARFRRGGEDVPEPPNGEPRMFLPHDPLAAESVTAFPDDLELNAPTVHDVERAAGTGLTGHSSQRFTPIQLGPLEREATVLQLRLVIASVEAIDAARDMVEPTPPARPAARP